MRIHSFFSFFLLVSLANAEEWSSFRGPSGMGTTDQNIPLQWDTSSIVWKTQLPGTGQSSAVGAGSKIFVTSGETDGARRHLLCVDQDNGQLLWQRTVRSSNPESVHRMNGWGTPTPATDGKRVVAFFGPAGLHCFDLNGKSLWSLNLGDFPGSWGVAASPIILNGIVYHNCDSMGPSRLIAVNLETGKIIWESPRAEKPRGGWSTPVSIEVNGKSQLVLNGEYGVRGYDLSSGSELWFSKGFNGRGSPIPFFGDGLLYVVNGKPGDLYAVKPALGDGQKSKMIWNAKRNGGRDLPSPAMLESMVFVTSMGGVITCYDAPTGKTLWIDRLEGAFSGSPLVSKSHYYIQNESGVTFVIEPDRKHLKVIARNRLSQSQEEIFRSTLSPISGKLYTRSLDQLYCFAGN